MKKLGKLRLSLNKETIAKLDESSMSNLKGGTGGATSTVCGNPTTETMGWNTCVACILDTITYGDCDMPTVGHDDGSICFSQSGFLCGDWCYGRGDYAYY
jgi:natural product precursor